MTDLRESHLRSIFKAFSWRVMATITTALITYVVTGQWKVAMVVSGIEFILKMLVYYIHERIWQLIPRGTIRKLYQRD